MKHLESMDQVIECARAQLEPGARDRTRIKRALVAQVMGLGAVGTSAVSKGAVATAVAGGLSTTPTIIMREPMTQKVKILSVFIQF